MKAKIIVNPMASQGGLGKAWPAIEEILRAEEFPFETVFTERRGQASQLARQALERGFDCIVAAGGDGTLHEVVNGMVAEGRLLNPAATLGIISAGTGSDFVRTAGLPREPARAAQLLARSSRTRLIDIGEVLAQSDGREVRRYFLNVAGLGFAAEVVEHAERRGKQGRGTFPYLLALFTTIFRFRHREVSLGIDEQVWEGRINSIVICNGRYFGGGMCVGPQASLDDGRLLVVRVGEFKPLEFLWHTPKLYRGTHLALEQVLASWGKQVTVRSPQHLSIQADGEMVGECPATFRILPGLLPLRV